MIFGGFWSVAIDTLDKLQFLIFIFAVLVSKLSNVPLYDYKIYLSNFFYSQDSGCPPYKIVENLKNNFALSAWDRYASACQISPKSVVRLQKYGDLTVFKMADVHRLRFLKFNFFIGRIG